MSQMAITTTKMVDLITAIKSVEKVLEITVYEKRVICLMVEIEYVVSFHGAFEVIKI